MNDELQYFESESIKHDIILCHMEASSLETEVFIKCLNL
jgi:hypothetical protein